MSVSSGMELINGKTKKSKKFLYVMWELQWSKIYNLIVGHHKIYENNRWIYREKTSHKISFSSIQSVNGKIDVKLTNSLIDGSDWRVPEYFDIFYNILIWCYIYYNLIKCMRLMKNCSCPTHINYIMKEWSHYRKYHFASKL